MISDYFCGFYRPINYEEKAVNDLLKQVCFNVPNLLKLPINQVETWIGILDFELKDAIAKQVIEKLSFTLDKLNIRYRTQKPHRQYCTFEINFDDLISKSKEVSEKDRKDFIKVMENR